MRTVGEENKGYQANLGASHLPNGRNRLKPVNIVEEPKAPPASRRPSEGIFGARNPMDPSKKV